MDSSIPHPTNFSVKLYVHQTSLNPSHVLGKRPSRLYRGKVRSFLHSLGLLSAECELVLSTSHLTYANALNYQRYGYKFLMLKGKEVQKKRKIVENNRSFRNFCTFPFPQKKNQDTLYIVWNKHGYINLLISCVIDALPMA